MSSQEGDGQGEKPKGSQETEEGREVRWNKHPGKEEGQRAGEK